MYKTLPIEIDRRRIYCSKLTHRDEDSDEKKFLYSFVISKAPHQKIQLLQIETQRGFKILQSSEGYKYDETIDGLYYFELVKSPDNKATEIRLHLGLSTDKEEDITKEESGIGLEAARVQEGTKTLYQIFLSDSDALDDKEITFTVRFYAEGNPDKYHESSFLLYCATSDQCIDLAVDFGSEASQAGYKISGNTSEGLFYVPLLEQLKRYYPNELGKVTKEQLHQYEYAPSVPLLKSVFVLKKDLFIQAVETKVRESEVKITREEAVMELSLEKPSEESPIRMALDREKSITDILIPNTKLMEIGNQQWFEEKFPEQEFKIPNMRQRMKQFIINQLLHACLDYIHQQHFAGLGKEMFCRLHLLVPNVYSQQQVYDLIRTVYEDIRKLGKAYGLCGVEVLVISESDAAFAGVMANLRAAGRELPQNVDRPETEEPQYLVIDAGKGTMDVSILNMVPNAQYQFNTFYRGGIPGAGQFLSFAFFEVLAHIFAPKMCKDIAEEVLYFLELHEKVEQGSKFKLWEIINMLKTEGFVSLQPQSMKDEEKYETQTFKEPISRSKAEEYHIKQFNDLIEDALTPLTKPEHRGKKLPDHRKTIWEAVSIICQQLRELIQQSGIIESRNPVFDGVMLTGRTFHFAPLREAIAQMLEELGVVQSENVLFDGKNAKSVSLNGALTDACKLNHSTDIVGALLLKRYPKSDSLRGFWDKILRRGEKTNAKGLETQAFNLNREFYLGLSKDNDYTPQSNDSFYIGNMHYCIGNRNDTITQEDIRRERPLKVNMEQRGYVLRFEKGRTSLMFSYNKPVIERDDLIVKSIFPLAAGEELIRIYKDKSDRERYKKQAADTQQKKAEAEKKKTSNNKRKTPADFKTLLTGKSSLEEHFLSLWGEENDTSSNDNAYKPDDKMDKPDDKIDKPDDKMDKPDDKIDKPDDKIDKPDDKIDKPDDKIDKPDDKMANYNKF